MEIHNNPDEGLQLVITLCKQDFDIVGLGNVRHVAYIEPSAFSNGLQRRGVILPSQRVSTNRSIVFTPILVLALAPDVTLLDMVWLGRRASCPCRCIIASRWWCIDFGTPIARKFRAACCSVGALLSGI